MARVTQLTMGEAPVDPGQWAQPMALTWAPAPDHVGLADVTRLEVVTAQLRVTDYEFGGGACRDAVLAQVGWAQQLLRATVGETPPGSCVAVAACTTWPAGPRSTWA